jgi:Uma2 family endonuclease
MAVENKLYTAEDLLRLPSEGKRYELVKGKLIEMSPPGRPHSVLTVWVLYLVFNHVRSGNLGEVSGPDAGFMLSRNPDTVRSPDISFISKDRLGPLEDSYYTVAPDLAVEVISPGNSETEMEEKITAYFRVGTLLVWYFYPQLRAIYVYHAPDKITVLGVDDTLDGGDVLPGFKVNVKDIFAVLDK